MQRIKNAAEFISSIEKNFHPNTYTSYCASRNFLSYGKVVFKLIDGLHSGSNDPWNKFEPLPEKWKLLEDDAKGQLSIQAGGNILKLRLQPASAHGDGTVPSDRSARHITGTLFVHGTTEANGYEHQNSYADTNVMASMLYSIVQIAKTAKWE